MAIIPSIGSGLGQTTQAAQTVYRKAMGMMRGPKKRKKKDAIDRAAGAAKKVVRTARKIKGAAKKVKGAVKKFKKGSAEAKKFMAKLRAKRKK